MHKRLLKNKIEKSLKVSPIVLLTGARQVGKTTLVKQIAQEHNFDYLPFDDMTYLTAARRDAAGFIESTKAPAIFDEMQRVPEIALPLKLAVDTNNKNGQYILTGSANPLAVPRLSDSLAGRMIILNLLQLSMSELLDKPSTWLDTIFDKQWEAQKVEKLARQDLIHFIVTGGYPRLQNLDQEMRAEWCNSHLLTVLERDAQDISAISRLKDLPNLTKILATRCSYLLNLSEIGRTAGIPTATLTSYLHILESLFLFTRQPAWHINLGKRLTKAPKLYMADSGLLAHLLGATEETLAANPLLFGQLLENFVIQEIRKQSTWNKKQIKLYHFRTLTGAEVDLVLENEQGQIVGIEIKSSASVSSNDLKGLQALATEAGDKFIRGIVIYTGPNNVGFGNNLFAAPVNSLWD